jgi:coenzyme PQQ precursor peptide PqqA
MSGRLGPADAARDHGPRDLLASIPAATVRRCATPTGDSSMQWQTPQACDFRFGFEITMYVAAR